MTHDDIIRMAREAGGCFENLPLCDAWLFYEDEHLERFAALVAAAERDRLLSAAEWCRVCEQMRFTHEQTKANATD